MTAPRLTPPLPKPSDRVFIGGINHPQLWLWDSWTYQEGSVTHLYTLALAKLLADGTPVPHARRNDYPFHFRHFTSSDGGQSWHDKGAILRPSPEADSYYSRNVWSGSATRLADGRVLIGLTGLRQIDEDHPFLQSIGLGLSRDGHTIESVQSEPLSCPLRDYDAIRAAGYYLGPKSSLGHKSGEDGGPILAWRDPFIYCTPSGALECFWSAKISPKVGAIARATLIETQAGFAIKKLHPPMILPDGESITQAEVPKIYFDPKSAIYYCLISACDRINETQPDAEVSKTLRLYKSTALEGPWAFYTSGRSILPDLPHMFGASVLQADFDAGQLHLIAPLTENAEPAQQLTLAPVQTISL